MLFLFSKYLNFHFEILVMQENGLIRKIRYFQMFNIKTLQCTYYNNLIMNKFFQLFKFYCKATTNKDITMYISQSITANKLH